MSQFTFHPFIEVIMKCNLIGAYFQIKIDSDQYIMSGRMSPTFIQGGGLYFDFGRSAFSSKSCGRWEQIKSERDFRTASCLLL